VQIRCSTTRASSPRRRPGKTARPSPTEPDRVRLNEPARVGIKHADGWSRIRPSALEVHAPRLQRGELSCAQRPQERVTDRARTGTAGLTTPGAGLLHHSHHEAGTTGLEPAASRLTSERSAHLSYAPSSAGGIRTHDLELMRLARTAAPLPRITDLAGRIRTCDLRCPKPVGWPTPLQPDTRTPGRIRTRSFRVESPAS